MASLSQTTQTTRSLLKWAGIALAAFFVIRFILFPISVAIYKGFFPDKPPPPTTKFGTLPSITFPQSVSAQTQTFSIQTTSGQLPPTCVFNKCVKNEDPVQPKNIPDRIRVYKFLVKSATFSSFDIAKQKVAILGFTNEGKPLSEAVYQWVHPKIEGKHIVFNTISDSFTLTTNITSPSAEFSEPPPPPTRSIEIAKDFLSRISLSPTDIDDTKTKTTFLRFDNGMFVETTSLSGSSVIQVDFFRKSIADLPIVYPNPQQSLLSFRVKNSRDRDAQIVEAHYAYKQIDAKEFSTYPIKTAQEAFEELKLGKGYIAKAAVLGKPITIAKVYNAYYEGNDENPYLMPVFVFEGEGFLAYVEAITSVWLE